MPLHVSSTCAHHQEVKIALHSLWYHHTYKFISCLYMFRANLLIIRRSKLHYTASGIITTVSLFLTSICFEHMCSSSGGQNCIKRLLTRGCVMQFWPPDDEHLCSKYVEAWNKLIVKQKFFSSSWLITEINILRCTVSKT